MYKGFREGGAVEPPKRAQIDTLNDGESQGGAHKLVLIRTVPLRKR